MSEAETIDTGAAAEVAAEKPEPSEAPKPSREDYDKAQEEKARKDGWSDFDDFVASGKDPAGWKPAAAFNLFKDMRGVLTRKEQEFSQRIEGVQKMAQSQLEAQRAELMGKRDAAIELGDVKQVHTIEKQINTLNQQPPTLPPGAAELSEWNTNNPWVTEKTPKAAFARELWNDLQSKMPITQALQVLESEITKHYPTTKPQPRGHVPEQETGKGPQGFGNKARTLTMADLNDEEKMAWKWQGQTAWKGDEKAFLKAATDMRKAAGGK